MTTVFLCHLLCLLTCCSAYENLALYKPAHQDKPYLQGNFSAEWAVDGRKSDLRGLAGQCSLSANNQYTITWWVNLTSICSIHDIRIYYRTENVAWENNGNEARFLGFSIYVSNTTNKSEGTLCYRDTNFTTSTIPAVFNTSCFVHGQYVIYYNERLPEKTYPSDYSDYAFGDLCEVEVYGCSTPGVFGINCTTPCPNTNCQYCHIETGSCQGCKTGYVGHQCVEECDNGRYGDGCQRQCGYCINRTQCHHVNGTCLKGCDAGYHGQMCNQKCGVGFYGQGCTIPCGKCFNQSNCSPINGTCPNGCLPGYKGDECHEQCTESFFGANCKEKCNATCLGCNRFTGICDKGCQPGWNGNDCQYECDNKTYGENCSKSCGNCKNNQQCDHINGTCTNGCENGYQVPKCDRECDNGTYGNGCDKTCGRCVNNTLCYHVNGTCFAGCDPGYWGSRCHQECNENKYGDGCKSICGHCFNMTQCNVENGTCLGGCDPGYEGQKCDRECQNRTYGNSCQRKCGHCLNGAQCDHTNGTCLQGCEPGYGGRTCHLVNLALHKPANEENIYNHENVTAGKAVDGRKSNLHGTGGECSTSATDQRTATWWVNLEAIYSIHDIRIYYRTDNVPWGTSNEFTARFLGFSLYVSNTTDKSDGKICFKDSNFTRSTIPAVLDITCFVHGQYVIYYNERLDGKIYPDYYSNFSFNDLCEVEVYGCPRPSYYGIDCNTPCPDTNCRYCHIETGICQGCKPGYVGHQCNFECENGWYGEGCQSKCGQCLNVTQCYHVNGTCFQGCAAGYEGQLCDQECKYGFFGENCVRECPAYCYSCNKSSGICDLGCHPGWKGKFCTEECDGNSYGENCSKSCGNCKNNQQCNHIDGACLNGCAIGYKDSKCDKECEEYMYGENCSFSCGNCEDNEKCNHIDGTCMGGCEKGYQGPRCDTECDSYRFGKNCSRQCGHCFNNSTCQHVNGTCIDGCDRGYQGTECMQKCFNNTYGHNCQEKCGRYCITCDIVTGVCDSGCFPGWKGDHCQKKCGDLFYGLNCSIPCGNCLNNEQCQNVYGYCENGCASGFHGNNCITECIDGYFGINCLEKCNETCNSCNKTSGVCEYGCQSGWKGDFCETECDGGLFGVNCSIECGHCLNDQQCHHINGTCLNGCDPGYTEDNCTKECDNNMFGENCTEMCGNCINSTQCHHINGSCPLGCEEGFQGPLCNKECDGGLFGVNCSIECGHCLNDQQCHHINGTCLNGCDPGYTEDNCTKECDNNMFGENCTEMCGNCINSTQCHHINGSCPRGCEEGFQGPLCNKECDGGLFGVNCGIECGHCLNDQQCHHINGTCLNGCDPGYTEDNCTKECDNNMFGENCTEMCGNCVNSTQCHHINGSCPLGCEEGFQGPLCNKECIDGRFGYDCQQNCSFLCVNGTCDKKNGSCEKIALRTDDKIDSDNSRFIGIGVGLTIIQIAWISILVFVCRRRHRTSEPSARTVNSHQRDEMNLTGQGKNSTMSASGSRNGRPAVETTPLDEGVNGILAEDPEYFNVTRTATPDIAIDKLKAVIAENGKNENEGFRKEYSALPNGELHKCDIGRKPENVPKNRYKTTFPYDHSRVVLDTRGGKKSDYIHANYIEGVNRKKEYIAAQGPKPNTLGDFWRMIWQEHVTTIVMLTNLKEGNKIKCHKYWPDKVKPTNYGTMLVKLCEEKEYAFYTTRQLSMYNKELKSTRAVTQYHYTAWPDHGVPEPLCLLTFFNHVMSTQVHNSQGPTTVHCSAGVGRTGTYIALDALYQIGKKRRKVNVAEFVTKMRQNRVSMVQTYEQYITIFLALNEIFKAPIQVDSMAEFSSKANKAGKNIPANQNTVRKEFQLLKKIRPNYTKGDYKFAFNALEGKQADKIMPLDKYSLHLSTGIPKRGSYINAITVPSFTNSQGFIVTKYPPTEDAVDLLRLLNDHESDTVISLQPLRQIESCNTWFPAVSSSLNIQPYTVHHQSKSHSDVTSHVIQIIKDDDEEHNVMVVEPDAEIHCSGSSSGDTSHIRSLVSTVLNLETKKPITILSSDGASLCGVFIAVHNVIQQMKMDDRVDVFTAVRQLQIRRPEFCARFEEYEMIYRALLDYNESASENIYYNQ